MTKLTKRTVEAAEPKEAEYMLWESDTPGFGVRVLPSGKKTYMIQYRVGTRTRRMALGYHGILTVDQARTQAITALASVRQGADPAGERQTQRHALTVADLADRFAEEHMALRIKASTAKEYRRNLDRFILPALGRLKIAEVTRPDIARFHHDLRHIPYQANRCLEIVSKMFNLAELWGFRPDGSNPRRHLKKYPEEKRERFLSMTELRRIGEVLREMELEGIEMPSAIAALMLLMLTGCRLSEIMTLKWDYVDFDTPALRLPDSKTGAKVVLEDLCVGCKVCTVACPFGTVNYVAKTGKVQKCDLCAGDPACAKACPTGAITYVDADWTGLDRMRTWAGRANAAVL